MLQLTREAPEGQQRLPVLLATAVWAPDVCSTQSQHGNYLPADENSASNSLDIGRKAKANGNCLGKGRGEQPLLERRLLGISC